MSIAGGWLFCYYVGVIRGLLDSKVITPNTPMAGASAGSLIAAVFHSGLPLEEVEKSMFALAEDCR